ncbi:hypothetical protein ANCCEY_03085 [Ancylostoma ceylanicum]|uniref:Uncharacterized protein n=1 Tax=Ancylostoma ceylanicum TaxID=53326 RepID=A0A0D6MBL4_9BILA|nr:hypothetical protein ANCCEY_03085 [Ancylostoma ceylanicum]
MPAVIKWRAAFKEIYGRTPTKSDYELAPANVKDIYKNFREMAMPTPQRKDLCFLLGIACAAIEFYSECPPSPSVQKEEISPHRKGGVRLKRPLEDESPLKRRPSKARRLCKDQAVRGVRSSPRKSAHGQASYLLSPVKSSPAVSRTPGSRRALSLLKEVQSTSGPSSFSSLTKTQPHGSPVKRVAAFSGFSSLFDTPEKGLSSESTTKQSLINVECLLLPTPEKRNREEEMKPFEPEEVVSKKSAAGRSKNGVAVAFDPKTGKVLKRAFKRTTPGIAKKKKVEGNFVRINMKKKSFSRGKVSAEQKRKMRRKQNWKRRMAGGGG